MLTNIGIRAKQAERVLMTASTNIKNEALRNIASALIENSAYIIEQNKTDIENARSMGIDAVFYRNCNYIGEEKLKISGMSELVGSVYSSLVNTTMFNGMNKYNPYFEYGYLYGGIYVLGFCNWIKNQAK